MSLWKQMEENRELPEKLKQQKAKNKRKDEKEQNS